MQMLIKSDNRMRHPQKSHCVVAAAANTDGPVKNFF